MKRAIQSKRDFLLKRHAGAIDGSDPQVIWVKMINCFGSSHYSSEEQMQLCWLAQKGKFNRILEDMLAKESNHFGDGCQRCGE